jgi:3'-phosphoadenosine 5'-phosphosulfate sulfotransferase (PAPS reductase)/FAD synthetase
MSGFAIEGPVLLSFSGGRTSARMLKLALEHFGGKLPPDWFVAFANTGKEREETLRFVHECGSRWATDIHWLEFIDFEAGAPPEQRFQVVGLNSAARNGEPLQAAIRRRKYLPNAVTRFCTLVTKVETIKHFMRAQGVKTWTSLVGLRHDEGHRVRKMHDRNAAGKDAWTSAAPLDDLKMTRRDVLEFWLGENKDPKKLLHPLPQGFDLGLHDYEGNCDMCFLKGYKALCHLERENPGMGDWWAGMELEIGEVASRPSGARFVTEYGYAAMQRDAISQPVMPGLMDFEDFDAECGLLCAPGEPMTEAELAAQVDAMLALPPPPAAAKVKRPRQRKK